MVVAVIILFAALIACTIVIIYLKRDIRMLALNLKTIEKSDTNMRMTTKTFDKDIIDLCLSINNILDKQQSIMSLNEKSNRELRQAITNISHDLRTPLTSAIGYIQMINSGKSSELKKQEYINIILYRLKSLSNLMEKLFEYTQIIEGKVNFTIEKVNICNILRDTISACYDEFMKKDFSVSINIPDAPIYVMCDTNSLRRVTNNLIQNVLSHGAYNFSLNTDSTNKTITFKNSVQNIEALDISRLFERFYTADFSRSGSSTGLGLAIANELVQGMGGKISAVTNNNSLEITIDLSF